MLKITNLKVNYGPIQAVKSISLEVKKGEIVCLLGPNGAGKSSTLKAIMGTVKSKGEIIFEKEDISGIKTHERVRKGIVLCPEGRGIFMGLTVYENLIAGAYLVNKSKIKENLEYVYSLFPRLKERKKQVAGTLSGGEQQMLAIARALMASPKLLLLDEPSLGLAPIIVSEIAKIIRDINKKGISVLLVEQNASLALKISTYGYVLETGRLMLQGNSEELLNSEEVKNKYLGVKK
nr:ABC transporter ATP-binding protein [Thermosipho ferrireducens]